MLFALNLPYEGEQPPPLLKLERTIGGGLFDRPIDNVDTISGNAVEVLTAPDQLDRYRTDDGEVDVDWSAPPQPSTDPILEPPGWSRQTNPPHPDGASRPNGAGRGEGIDAASFSRTFNAPLSRPGRMVARAGRNRQDRAFGPRFARP